MNTIITVNDIINSGLRISSDISDSVIQFAIETVERAYVTDMIPIYQDILTNPSQYQDIINGTNKQPSLRSAICHLVYAWVLYDNFFATRYATVEKYADESNSPELKNVKQVSMQHWEVGQIMIRKINKFNNLSTEGLMRTGLIFNELMWGV